jgi:hypothetical protein
VQKASIVGIQGSNGGFVGCGFAVTSRHILTCAHVVNAALGRTQESGTISPIESIKVCFVHLGNQAILAKVVYWKPVIHDLKQLPSVNLGIEEDIVGLELLDVLVGGPVKPVQIQLATENLEFKAFGYPNKILQGASAQGLLQIHLPCGWFELAGKCSKGFWAEPGYSGTPVRSIQDENSVYGMMVASRKQQDDGVKIAYMIPAQGLDNAIAHLKLLEILPCVATLEDPLGKVYLSAYQRCCPDDWGLGLAHGLPETLSEILMQLNEMQPVTIPPAESQVERKLEFVARLLVSPDFGVTELEKEALRSWGTQRVTDFLSLLDRVRDISEVEAVEPVIADPCLMIEVSPNDLPYTTKAFFIADTQTYQSDDATTWQEIFCWDFEQKQERVQELEAFEQDDLLEAIERKLKQRLAGYIITCRKKYRKDGRFRIELILPLSLMNEPIERWELEIGGYAGSIVPASEYPVVIRSYDRTTDEYQEELGDLCRERWAKLHLSQGQQAAGRLAAVAAKAKTPQLNAAYKNPLVAGIKVSEILPVLAQPNFFGASLASGTPVAVWLRESPDNSFEPGGGVNSVLNELDNFLQCLVGQIGDEALIVRAQAIAVSIEPDETNFMVGHHLSLLWENPHLLPPSPPKQASE